MARVDCRATDGHRLGHRGDGRWPAVFGAHFNGSKPTEVLRRLPRKTQLGPTKGIWGQINVGEEKTWVHAKFRKNVRAADALAPSS